MSRRGMARALLVEELNRDVRLRLLVGSVMGLNVEPEEK